MNILTILTDTVSEAFDAAGYLKEYGAVSVSSRPDLCQFQCNGSMSAAKAYRKSPMIIANAVADALKQRTEIFQKVEVAAPGFINLTLNDGYLASLINDMQADERLLLPKMQHKTIVVDYGGPNIAKPLHVGHLRSAIIGESLCRLLRFLGHTVVGDIHLGDWGLQMGMVIAELKKRTPHLCYFDPEYQGNYPDQAPVTADDLNEIYPTASARAKSDPAFAQAAALATAQLQEGRRGYYALWQQIRSVSIADLKRSYDILGVQFDKWYGESDADPYIPDIMKALREQNLLRESEGALVVDVARPEDKEPMPPMIIVKSNGADMYGTTDLGTILQRKRDFDPDEIWYVVDNRQALHFKQVFRCAALAGVLGNTQCHHVGFGTMNGKDGKPYKTREGGVMRLSDLIDTVTSSAYEKASESMADMDEDVRKAVARQTGVAAMKIGDMLNHRAKDYIFDMERFLASEGKTGPYLQYAVVRINSLLKKAQSAGESFGEILPPASEVERALMLKLTSASEALMRTYEEKAPSVLCETMFDIAGLFNRFYMENRILTCPDRARRASWLSLCMLTRRILNVMMDIIGLDLPEQM